jgi:chorismate synthase
VEISSGVYEGKTTGTPEIGAGSASVEQLGTEHGDEMTPDGFLSNNAGGISTGQDIVVSIAVIAH